MSQVLDLAFGTWKDRVGNLWMMGGKDYNNAYLNDMWKYNVVTNQWTWVRGANVPGSSGSYGTLCVSSPSNDPSARDENRMCWVDSCGNFWMFGGFNGTTGINDLWFYDVQLNEWTWASGNGAAAYGALGVPAATNLPTVRLGGAPYKSQNGGELWFWGGKTNVTAVENDFWRFTIDTNCTKCIDYTVTANFNATGLSGCPPLTVNFNNTSINATSWSWDFGDGNISNGQNPNNTYANPGQYTVTLIATNGINSDTTVFINYVTVYPQATAVSTASSDTLCVGQNVSFTNSSTNATAYNWSFGNGNTSVNATPTTSYNSPGNYSVTLIASNANGCNDTLTIPIVGKTKPNFKSKPCYLYR